MRRIQPSVFCLILIRITQPRTRRPRTLPQRRWRSLDTVPALPEHSWFWKADHARWLAQRRECRAVLFSTVNVVSDFIGYDFETIMLMTRAIQEAWDKGHALLAPSAKLEDIHAAMVRRIMQAVETGERDPSRLRALALSEIRGE